MRNQFNIKRQSTWRWWVTPRYLREKPIHRWCIFPHSFTSELVHGLIKEWKLGQNDKILDPFCGAGTTLLASKEKIIPATGYDLSPFAIFASQVKLYNYDVTKLSEDWGKLKGNINPTKWNGASRSYPELIQKALPGHLLGAFDSIDNCIEKLDSNQCNQRFFKMGLLSTLPKFSRAIASGGWLKWVNQKRTVRSLLQEYDKQIQSMITDLLQNESPKINLWKAKICDARKLPDSSNTYSAVITSPPYPNRHDYTRVFGIELMFGFLNWEQTRDLRYQSFESHPESHPKRPNFDDYQISKSLTKTLDKIKKSSDIEDRIAEMINGYFIDLHLCLREIKRVCKKRAKIAFVVGNAQYGGIPIMVDTLTAEIAKNLGLKCNKIIAARFRGNSAQQMSIFGRRPSRESVVILTNG